MNSGCVIQFRATQCKDRFIFESKHDDRYNNSRGFSLVGPEKRALSKNFQIFARVPQSHQNYARVSIFSALIAQVLSVNKA